MDSIYDFDDYKPLIKERVKELKSNNPSVTLRKLSSQIPVQYTYFSKVLNNDSAHLNEDDLFRLGELMKLSEGEKEFLLLLRSKAISQSEERRTHLTNKIESLRKQKLLRAEVKQNVETRLSEEMEYLFDPLCFVVHTALHIKSYEQNPSVLCTKLNVGLPRLKKVLRILEKVQVIELSPDDPLKIKKMKYGHIHYGKEHPLMRTQQMLMKSAIPAKLQQVEEDEKHSFLTTFTLSPHDFDKVKGEFQTFIQKVEKIVQNSNAQSVYQINFDLFKWL